MARGLKASPRHRVNDGARPNRAEERISCAISHSCAGADGQHDADGRNLQGYDPCSLTAHTAFVLGVPTAMPSNPFVPSLRRAVFGLAAARLVVLAVAGCVLLGYGVNWVVSKPGTTAGSSTGPLLRCTQPDRTSGAPRMRVVRITRAARIATHPPVRALREPGDPVLPGGAVDRWFRERSPAAGSGAAIVVSRARGPERVRRES